MSYRQNATPDPLRGRMMSAVPIHRLRLLPVGALLGVSHREVLDRLAFSFGGVLVGILTIFMFGNLGSLD